MLLQARFNQVNDQIGSYLEQIAALQAEVTRLQAHAQEIQSVEQAAESALNQIDVAIAMFQAVCPEDLDTFFAAIDAKRKSAPQLQAAYDDADNNANPHIPDAPNPIEPATIEVVATLIDDTQPRAIETTVVDDAKADTEHIAATDPVSENTNSQADAETPSAITINDADSTSEDTAIEHNGNGNGNGHRLLTYKDLQIVERPTLVKLANTHGIPNYKARKRDELANLLDGIISEAELADAQNGDGKR